MITRSHPSSAFIAATLSASLLGACGKADEPKAPDAERIRMVAQAVLAASDRKGAQEKRDAAHKAWGEVTEALQALRRSLLAGSTVNTQDATAQRADGIKQVLAALDAANQQIQRAAGGGVGEGEVLSAGTLKGGVRAKIDSLRAEVKSWEGKSAADQLRAVTQMLTRIEIRSAYVPQKNGETPTVSTFTEHR